VVQGASTVVIVLYVVLSTLVWPLAYNYWAVLGLDAFGVLIWLVSFALLASEVNEYKDLLGIGTDAGSLTSGSSNSYGSGTTDCYIDVYGATICARDLGRRSIAHTYYSVNAAAAGIGALEL
jgi:hypothetical protein